MMWRLNFLVMVCCLALNNSYMLYYICPMHTLFTVMVYGGGRESSGVHARPCLPARPPTCTPPRAPR